MCLTNPLRSMCMRSEGYGTWFVSVCVSVCLSVFYHIFSHHTQWENRRVIPNAGQVLTPALLSSSVASPRQTLRKLVRDHEYMNSKLAQPID